MMLIGYHSHLSRGVRLHIPRFQQDHSSQVWIDRLQLLENRKKILIRLMYAQQVKRNEEENNNQRMSNT